MERAEDIGKEIAQEFERASLGVVTFRRYDIVAASGSGLKRIVVGRAVEIFVGGLSAVILRNQLGWKGEKDGLFLLKGLELNGDFRKGWAIARKIAAANSVAIRKKRFGSRT